MIDWYTYLLVAVALVGGVFCLLAGLIGRRTPSDYTVGSLALTFLLLLLVLPIAIVSLFTGNPILGDPLEFWMYWGTAVLIMFIAGVLALVERNRWSTVIMGVAGLSVAIMSWRMLVVWSTAVL